MTNKNLCIIKMLSCVLIFLFLMPVYGNTSNIIEIFRGNSRVIKTDFDIVKVATGDEDICVGTKTSDREVLINAKSVGKSNIIVWGPKGERKEVIVIVKSLEMATEK